MTSTRGEPSVTEESNHPNSTERVVAALWRETLQMSDLPKGTDNFFTLGGDSMTMTMLEFRILEELSVKLTAGAILNAQTLRELSDVVDQMREKERLPTAL